MTDGNYLLNVEVAGRVTLGIQICPKAITWMIFSLEWSNIKGYPVHHLFGEGMNPDYIVGSIITKGGPQPFVMHTRTAKLEVGNYTKPDETQQNLSVIQQQRFVLLIAERTGVSFAEVRLGQYHCSECGQWVEATPEQWSLSVCLSCSMDRASEMHERYQEEAQAAEAAAQVAEAEPVEAPTVSAAPDEEPAAEEEQVTR